MRGKLRRWWPAVKALLGLAIVVAVGRRFAADLVRPEVAQRPVHLGWLALSGLLYLAGIGLSAVYWRRLLGYLGPRPGWGVTLRAYYLGHLGKYLPGKAWALLLRADLVSRGGVRPGLAGLTSFYEVLTTMAAGALVAAVLFAALGADAGPGVSLDALRGLVRGEQPAGGVAGRGLATALALLLFAATALPLLPPVFNAVAGGLAARFREAGAAPVGRVGGRHLAEGLLLTGVGWLLLGAALACAVRGVVGDGVAWTPAALGRMTAGMALSYVAGFVVLVAPGGIGVREFFLTLFLAPELAGLGEVEARAAAVLTVVVLRLAWTAAELLLAGALYWLPTGPPAADYGLRTTD